MFELRTMTGKMCAICPVSSNTITETEIVWVIAPDIAAAPGNVIVTMWFISNKH